MRVHRPSVAGRFRADRGALLLTGTVIAITSLLAVAVPVAMRTVADRAVSDAVARAGPDADVVVGVPLPPRDPALPAPDRRSAEEAAQAAEQARGGIDPRLAAVLQPPVTAVTSTDLTLTDGGPGRVFRFGYLTGGAGPRVRWTAGGPPSASSPSRRAVAAYRSGAGPWPVQVGLSEQVAEVLGLRPGDRIAVEDEQHDRLDVRVSGVFRATDPGDVAWRVLPRALRAATGVRTEAAGLLSADSLPDGRLALPEQAIRCTVTFLPRAALLNWGNAAALSTAAVATKAATPAAAYSDSLIFDTQLDGVLARVRRQVSSAAAQASVLLVGLVTGAVLVLLLAVDLIISRRERVLVNARIRGASGLGLAAELALESVTVTLAGAAGGVVAARLLVGGIAWPGLVPVLAVGVLTGPVIGVLRAVRATGARRSPANRSARRWSARTRALRRAVLELAVIALAAAAFVALRERGVAPAGSSSGFLGGDGLLPALAPTLGAVVGALVLLRVLPVAVGWWLTVAVRSRRGLPLITASRAAVATQPLPVVALVVCTALLTVAVSLVTTQAAGQAVGAWRDVGADARIDLPGASDPAPVAVLAARLAAASGVRQVVTASVTDVLVSSATSTVPVHLVVLDAAAYGRLLAAGPLPSSASLGASSLGSASLGSASLGSASLGRSSAASGGVPALLSGGSALRSATRLSLPAGDRTVALHPVGSAPPVGIPGSPGEILVVDAAAFAAAGGVAVPNTIWVLGPGSTRAVAASRFPATLRPDVLAARRDAPLAQGLSRFGHLCAGLLLLLGLLTITLAIAAGRPGRSETISWLGTLGLNRREARWVAVGESLPFATAGALVGAGLGVGLARVSLGFLDLSLLTGQGSDRAPVVPWAAGFLLLVFPSLVILLVLAERSPLLSPADRGTPSGP